MSHEVEKMMFIGETPWHGIGTKVEEAPTSEEAIQLAGLNWKVRTEPVYRETSEGYKIVSNARVTVRESDESELGIVGKNYTVLQNSDAFRFFDPFVQTKEAQYNTAGSLMNGKKIWVLAKLNRDPLVITKDDVVEKYLLLSNSHDGSTSVRVGFTPIRVVCANTLASAHGDSESQLLRLYHTAGLHKTIEAVKEVVNIANQQFEATAEQYRYLASRNLHAGDLEKYVKTVFYPEVIELTDRQQTRLEALTQDIQQIFQVGRGMTSTPSSWWKAYNSVNEYLNYNNAAIEDKREKSLESLWFGSIKLKNEEAFSQALKMAA